MSVLIIDRFDDEARNVLDDSIREALAFGKNYVAPEHILLAAAREFYGDGSEGYEDIYSDVVGRVTGEAA